MPAHLFELLFMYYKMRAELGKAPTAIAVAAALKIDKCTVLQRRDSCVQLGIIEDPGLLPRYRDWALLTDRGAEMFAAVLDGIDEAVATHGHYLSTDRDIFPDTIRYTELSMYEYQKYLASISDNGQPPS